MTSIQAPAAQRPRKSAPRLLPSIRRASFAMSVVLLVQYILGIAVNLFVTLPRRDHGAGPGGAIGRAISDGPRHHSSPEA